MIIKNDQSEIQNYLVDASNYKGNCEAVYFPEKVDDVKSIFDLANKNNKQITIAGNGTGLTGSCVPTEGVVISTEKLNKIISIDKENKTAVVQPGIILSELLETFDNQGLYYPPDPTEQNCFIGGTVATNASGAKSFKYGPTRNFVIGLKVILADGELLNINRDKVFADGNNLTIITESGKEINIEIPQLEMPKTKHAAGYYCKDNMDAIDLFIGSEGTLGFIYEITLKLLDKPTNLLSCVTFFDEEKDALGFIDQSRSFSSNSTKIIDARGIEFFDFFSLQFLNEELSQIPNNTNCAVWFEQEFEDKNEELVFESWINLINKYNGNEETAWFAIDKKEREKLQDFRHAVSWKVSEYIASKNITKVGTDFALPIKKFEEYYYSSTNKVKEANIEYVIFGHAGDCHLHLNMLPKNDDEFKKAKSLYNELCKIAVESGGTISAEHGIGKIKPSYLEILYGKEKVKEMARLKKSLDENLILGIGNIFNKSIFDEL